MIDTPTWFGPTGRALFGWFCAPDSGCSDYGVLLCSPIGEEEHNAHETLRRTAWGLAQQGIASLRFDYHGTGDSTGLWSDPDRVDAWLTSITDAYDALRATGVPRVGGLGMRIGATLLATSTTRSALDLDTLVLWDSCSGKSMLREGLARSPSPGESGDGSVETPGYRYTPRTVTALHRLDPVTLEGDVHADRVMVLNRDDRPPPRGLRRRLPPSDSVHWATCTGMSEMLDVPMDKNTVPDGAVAQVVDWIVQHADRRSTETLKIPSAALDLPQSGGETVIETAVRLGRAGLFGICTEPTTRTRSATVVFVNVANDRQTGPGRRWVDTCRSLAADGFRCVRLSQSGTGDSPTSPGQTFGELYCPEWLDDLPDALSDPLFDNERIALISLCSGAYSALEAAMRVSVAVVYPINVILTIHDTSRGQRLHSAERQVARPVGRAFLPRPGHSSASAVRRRGIAWRLYRQVSVRNAPLSAVHGLVRRDTAVVLLMSPDDGRHFRESAFWSGLFAWRWRRRGMFELPIDARIDHPLMTQNGQQAVVTYIQRDLHDRFPSERGPVEEHSMSERPTHTTTPEPTSVDGNSPVWTQSASTYRTHFNWNDAGERIAIRQVADQVRGARILDVGVGAGRTSWLVGLLSGDYTGIDYTPAMVDTARQNCPWADIRVGDACALDIESDSVDFVFFSNAGIDSLDHERRSRALAEFARVLRPDGILVYSTLNRSGPFYGAHPGPIHAPGKLPSPYRVGRFVARAGLQPRSHLAGFQNVRRHANLFEDHGDWAIDTMPTHDWSLVVHYITTAAAREEVRAHGFGSTALVDQYGAPVDTTDTAASSAWFYVITRLGSDDRAPGSVPTPTRRA